MDTEEARKLIAQELEIYQAKSYSELVKSIGETINMEKKGMGTSRYQIEIIILWDNQPGGAIRIIGTIDDGGWRAFFPLNDNILKYPED